MHDHVPDRRLTDSSLKLAPGIAQGVHASSTGRTMDDPSGKRIEPVSWRSTVSDSVAIILSIPFFASGGDQ
jgi:hypothetical protein